MFSADGLDFRFIGIRTIVSADTLHKLLCFTIGE